MFAKLSAIFLLLFFLHSVVNYEEVKAVTTTTKKQKVLNKKKNYVIGLETAHIIVYKCMNACWQKWRQNFIIKINNVYFVVVVVALKGKSFNIKMNQTSTAM